jgi:hypothetical protein
LEQIDPLTAADRYRRACELKAQAKAQLAAAVAANRRSVNLRQLAARAGVNESALHQWVKKEVSVNGGI